MKIAMLTNNYRPFVGGVPISVERQAQELVKLGHQVTVFAPAYESEDKEQAESFREKILEEDKKAPERVIRYHSQKKKMENGMVYPGIYPAEIFKVFERERFDCWERNMISRLSIHITQDMKTIFIIFRASGSMRGV